MSIGKGWAFSYKGTRAHYFDEECTSLCGKASLPFLHSGNCSD